MGPQTCVCGREGRDHRAPHTHSKLQWGRRLASAEAGQDITVAAVAASFNGAADLRLRKVPMRLSVGTSLAGLQWGR